MPNIIRTAENVARRGTANGYASLDAGAKVPYNQLPYYLAPGSNAAALTAMIASLTPSATVGYTIYLGEGQYTLDARVTVPAWINIVGAGKRTTTRLLCTTAGSGIDFVSRGGVSGHFTIDGNNISTNPFRTNGVQRTFIDVDVRNDAGEGAIVTNAQNCIFQSLDVDNSAGTCLVLENGAKNCLFLRCEFDDAATYLMKTRQNLASGAAHPLGGTVLDAGPNLHLFVKCLFERLDATTGLAAIHHTAGDLTLYDSELASTVAVPQILMDWQNNATYCNLRFESSRVTDNGGGGIGFQTEGADFFSIDITGRCKIRCGTAYKPNDNTEINVGGLIDYSGTTTIYTNNTGGTKVLNNQVRSRHRQPIQVQAEGTNQPTFYGFRNGGSGYGPSLRTDRILVGNETTFTEASIPAVISCTGTPEGAVSAPIGSLALRIDGGVSTTLYVKQSGTGVTGWVAK